MSESNFVALIERIAAHIEGDALDVGLERKLNREFPVRSDDFTALARYCAQGENEGWLMAREAACIKFGRAVKPGEIPGSFSVDVVRMKNVQGPHHIHSKGEIGAILPISGEPLFDGRQEGWYVYGPGSDHHPTVEGGDAYVLYLLPDGAIEFTGK